MSATKVQNETYDWKWNQHRMDRVTANFCSALRVTVTPIIADLP